MDFMDSRCVSGFRAPGVWADRSGALDHPLSVSATATGATSPTAQGVSDRSHRLWLPSSSRAASARRLADQPQAGLSALQGGGAGSEAQAAPATKKRGETKAQSSGSRSERTVGDGLHA